MAMATINTDFLIRCIGTLELTLDQLRQHEPGEFIYEVFRSACVKEFEIVLEQSGSLLRKPLRPYFAYNRQADSLATQGRVPICVSEYSLRRAWVFVGGVMLQ